MTTNENILSTLRQIVELQQHQLEAMRQMARTLEKISANTDSMQEVVKNIEFRQREIGEGLAGP